LDFQKNYAGACPPGCTKTGSNPKIRNFLERNSVGAEGGFEPPFTSKGDGTSLEFKSMDFVLEIFWFGVHRNVY